MNLGATPTIDAPPASAALFGLKIKLDRACGGERRCHDNIVVINPGKPPHIGELRCSNCNVHRGWLSKATGAWILAVVKRFGRPIEPINVYKGRRRAEAHND
jgi:hypothetical protein